ncbi:hypothetical protein [Sphingobium sp. B12D2B]|uniref:hypothetical protein n=1 Tax=Sphingobium sp. B12D2B TaxID=2940577 RepID=UPI002225ACD4|nr:hypothetical protein [Sphingobium sp. B12D2B]MCW2351584.1 SAM-dependent methyltransferase [Sphingobium sp. B12D2B]
MQLTNRNRPHRVPEDEAPQPSGPKPRFYDSRQNYLMFVHSCTEKLVIADRVAQELEHLDPQQPALRFFDAGVGDGTVMSRLLRAMHRRFPRLPFYVVGKEISLEDLRLALDKLPDRFVEHPETVVALTNISYAEAPWLRRSRPQAQKALVWKDVALHGETSADMEQQIQSLMPFLADHWRMKVNPATGALSPETPTVLLLYREAYRFILDRVIPRPAATRADFDLVLASQPFRLKADVQFKAERVLAPLARALRPGGRLIVVQSAGDDPAMEIIRKVWPEEQPFPYSRQDLIRATQAALSGGTAHYAFDTLSDEAASIRFEMHVLGSEGDRDATLIGTSALYSAWIAATYVAQIENERVAEQMTRPGYLTATREVLAKHGRLWFRDECLVIERVE